MGTASETGQIDQAMQMCLRSEAAGLSITHGAHYGCDFLTLILFLEGFDQSGNTCYSQNKMMCCPPPL